MDAKCPNCDSIAEYNIKSNECKCDIKYVSKDDIFYNNLAVNKNYLYLILNTNINKIFKQKYCELYINYWFRRSNWN